MVFSKIDDTNRRYTFAYTDKYKNVFFGTDNALGFGAIYKKPFGSNTLELVPNTTGVTKSWTAFCQTPDGRYFAADYNTGVYYSDDLSTWTLCSGTDGKFITVLFARSDNSVRASGGTGYYVKLPPNINFNNQTGLATPVTYCEGSGAALYGMGRNSLFDVPVAKAAYGSHILVNLPGTGKTYWGKIAAGPSGTLLLFQDGLTNAKTFRLESDESTLTEITTVPSHYYTYDAKKDPSSSYVYAATSAAGNSLLRILGDATEAVSGAPAGTLYFDIDVNGRIVIASFNDAIYVQKYGITYNGNGHTGGTVPVDAGSYYEGANIIILGNTGSLVKAGYRFVGWNTAADGSGTRYLGGSSYLVGLSDVTLYAEWIPVYGVTYHGNGNTSGTVPVDPAEYAEGEPVTVLGGGTLERDGYEQDGWNTAPDGSGTPRAIGATFSMGTADVDLYAVWVPLFMATYHDNLATSGTAPVDPGFYHTDDPVTVLDNVDLARDGHRWMGWSLNEDGSGTLYEAGDEVAATSDLDFYPVWQRTYSVTYDPAGASGAVPVDGNRYVLGESATLLPGAGLSVAGKAFVGWSVGSGPLLAAGDTVTVTGDIVPVAQFQFSSRTACDRSIQVDVCAALADVQAIADSQGTPVTVRVRGESDVKRGGMGSITRRSIIPTFNLMAFPVEYSPSTRSLEKAGLREESEVVIYTPMKSWVDSGIVDIDDINRTMLEIDITRTTVLLDGVEWKIAERGFSGRIGAAPLYITFSLRRN